MILERALETQGQSPGRYPCARHDGGSSGILRGFTETDCVLPGLSCHQAGRVTLACKCWVSLQNMPPSPQSLSGHTVSTEGNLSFLPNITGHDLKLHVCLPKWTHKSSPLPWSLSRLRCRRHWQGAGWSRSHGAGENPTGSRERASCTFSRCSSHHHPCPGPPRV